MEIKIEWNHGKEYATRKSMEKQIEKFGASDEPYIVVTNPNNGKVRPIFIVSASRTKNPIALAQNGWMIVGTI